MEERLLLEKIRQQKFIKNNGRVLRAVNVLRENYVPLYSLRLGLSDDITESEYTDSINYLCEIGFIKVRNRITHTDTTIADTEFHLLEGKLSAKGIQFLAGKIKDDCIEW